MGAIILDASKVNSYVLPNLTKSKNIILSACSINNALRNSLPNSFSYKNYISNIATQLYNIQKEISNINQIIIKKIEKAKSIESSGQNRTAAISRIASSIGAISGTVGGAMIGSTGGVAGAVIGATIGNKVGKTIGNTGAKIVGKTVSGIKIVGSSIVNGFKWIGSKVTKAYKSATNWISDKAKKVSNWVVGKLESAKNWTCKALKDTGAFISKVGTTIWSGLKKAWNWAKDVENWKRLGASIANGAIAFVKGVVSLVEALGDLIILIGSGICTTRTALYDLGKGIVTGNWNFDATKGLWKKTKSIVSYQWTNKAFDAFYETKAGKWLDSNAYKPFKSDGLACQILEGVGYVAGVIALTVLTFGVGGVAVGATTTVSAGVSATTMAATAAAVGFGKYTAEEWNKNSISINYNGTDMDIAVDYEKYSQIEKLKSGETTTISQQITLADGSVQEIKFYITAKGNGEYLITDSQGNVAKLNDLKESSTVKGLAIGGLKGAWEGAQWYVGGKINGLFKGAGSVISNKLLSSLTRVGLDSLTGAVEVPFQSFVTMLSEGKSWSEAWNANGGWDAVKKQAAIGALSSGFGESLDFITGSVASKKIVSALENSNDQTDKIISSQLSKLSDLEVKKLLDGMDDASKINVLKNMDPKRFAEFSKIYSGVNSKNQLKSADMASNIKSKKFVDCSSEEISKQIDFEISKLDISDPDYSQKLSLLENKRQLELDLHKNMKKISNESISTKSIDLLSPSQKTEVISAAQSVYNNAIQAEKSITEQMQKIAGNDAYLEGLDFRIKSYDSIEDKISRKVAKYGTSVDSAKLEINDSLRYTLIVDEKSYEKQVLSRLAELQKEGYSIVDINNSWGNLGSPTYQGLNVTLKTSDGILTELQFHTANSFKVKQTLNHEFYEISRNAASSPELKKISDEIQKINQKLFVETVDFKYKTAGELSSAVADYQKIINSTISSIDTSKNQIKVSGTGKQYGSYSDFMNDNKANVSTWDSIVKKSSDVKDAMRQYKGEFEDPGGYKIVNGYLRGTLFDDTNQIVTIKDTFGTDKVISYSEFEKSKGMSISQYRQKIESALNNLESSISQCHLSTDTKLIRGVNFELLKSRYGISESDTAETIFNKIKNSSNGTTFKEEGFMSVCPLLDEQELPYIVADKKVRFIIDAEADIEARIFPNDYEKEILLNHGQSFDIYDVKKELINGEEKVLICMKHILNN